MYPFSDQNGTVHPTVSPLSLDMPVLNNIDNQCATICQKGFENDKTVKKSATSFSSQSGRKQFNPNEIIFFENVKSKCLIQFDQSYARAKVKSKSSKSVSGTSSLGNTNSGVSSLSSMTASSSSISATNPNDNKKICVESSRHILTHNGLVIQHPTLRIVPIPIESPMDIIEGQTLSSLEFYLKLDSKNPTSNAQYFDLVLKVI